jgi:hypothetical protein
MTKRLNNITSIDSAPRPTRRGENGRVALAAYATHR